MGNRKMFFRILGKALTERRGRVFVALIALVVGAAVAAAMLSVYYDAERKMSRELRAYGANLMLAPAAPGGFIPQTMAEALPERKNGDSIIGAAPYLYLVGAVTPVQAGESGAPSTGSTRVVVVGTWFDQMRKVSPWQQIEGRWIEDRRDEFSCVAGKKVAKQLGIATGAVLTVAYDAGNPQPEADGAALRASQKPVRVSTRPDRSMRFEVAGVVTTGAEEDNRIFVELGAAQKLAGLEGQVSAIAVSAVGGPEQIDALASSIAAQSDSVTAHPVRQLAESEGRVLGKLRLMILLVTVLILAGATLSVATTLTALVTERRQEIGTMKAIGAGDAHLLRLFLSQLGALGLAGGVMGYLIGLGLAQAIGVSLFNSTVAPRFVVFAMVLGIALAVALLSGLAPLKRIREFEPAVILRGD